MKQILTSLLLLGLLLPISLSAQIWKRDLNQHDAENRRVGKWKSYTTSDSTQKRVLQFKARYCNGEECGRSIMFSEDGKRLNIFRYNKKNDQVVCKHYYPDGTMQRRAEGQMVYTEKYLRFFLDGDCRYYNRNGKLSHTVIFKDGVLLEEVKRTKHYYNPQNNTIPTQH